MSRFINNFYFTLLMITLLAMFSIIFWENINLYMIMSLAIIFSTLITEIFLNNRYALSEKGKKMGLTIIPINIIVFLLFVALIF